MSTNNIDIYFGSTLALIHRLNDGEEYILENGDVLVMSTDYSIGYLVKLTPNSDKIVLDDIYGVEGDLSFSKLYSIVKEEGKLITNAMRKGR